MTSCENETISHGVLESWRIDRRGLSPLKDAHNLVYNTSVCEAFQNKDEFEW